MKRVKRKVLSSLIALSMVVGSLTDLTWVNASSSDTDDSSIISSKIDEVEAERTESSKKVGVSSKVSSKKKAGNTYIDELNKISFTDDYYTKTGLQETISLSDTSTLFSINCNYLDKSDDYKIKDGTKGIEYGGEASNRIYLVGSEANKKTKLTDIPDVKVEIYHSKDYSTIEKMVVSGLTRVATDGINYMPGIAPSDKTSYTIDKTTLDNVPKLKDDKGEVTSTLTKTDTHDTFEITQSTSTSFANSVSTTKPAKITYYKDVTLTGTIDNDTVFVSCDNISLVEANSETITDSYTLKSKLNSNKVTLSYDHDSNYTGSSIKNIKLSGLIKVEMSVPATPAPSGTSSSTSSAWVKVYESKYRNVGGTKYTLGVPFKESHLFSGGTELKDGYTSGTAQYLKRVGLGTSGSFKCSVNCTATKDTYTFTNTCNEDFDFKTGNTVRVSRYKDVILNGNKITKNGSSKTIIDFSSLADLDSSNESTYCSFSLKKAPVTNDFDFNFSSYSSTTSYLIKNASKYSMLVSNELPSDIINININSKGKLAKDITNGSHVSTEEMKDTFYSILMDSSSIFGISDKTKDYFPYFLGKLPNARFYYMLDSGADDYNTYFEFFIDKLFDALKNKGTINKLDGADTWVLKTGNYTVKIDGKVQQYKYYDVGFKDDEGANEVIRLSLTPLLKKKNGEDYVFTPADYTTAYGNKFNNYDLDLNVLDVGSITYNSSYIGCKGLPDIGGSKSSEISNTVKNMEPLVESGYLTYNTMVVKKYTYENYKNIMNEDEYDGAENIRKYVKSSFFNDTGYTATNLTSGVLYYKWGTDKNRTWNSPNKIDGVQHFGEMCKAPSDFINNLFGAISKSLYSKEAGIQYGGILKSVIEDVISNYCYTSVGTRTSGGLNPSGIINDAIGTKGTDNKLSSDYKFRVAYTKPADLSGFDNVNGADLKERFKTEVFNYTGDSDIFEQSAAETLVGSGCDTDDEKYTLISDAHNNIYSAISDIESKVKKSGVYTLIVTDRSDGHLHKFRYLVDKNRPILDESSKSFLAGLKNAYGENAYCDDFGGTQKVTDYVKLRTIKESSSSTLSGAIDTMYGMNIIDDLEFWADLLPESKDGYITNTGNTYTRHQNDGYGTAKDFSNYALYKGSTAKYELNEEDSYRVISDIRDLVGNYKSYMFYVSSASTSFGVGTVTDEDGNEKAVGIVDKVSDAVWDDDKKEFESYDMYKATISNETGDSIPNININNFIQNAKSINNYGGKYLDNAIHKISGVMANNGLDDIGIPKVAYDSNSNKDWLAEADKSGIYSIKLPNDIRLYNKTTKYMNTETDNIPSVYNIPRQWYGSDDFNALIDKGIHFTDTADRNIDFFEGDAFRYSKQFNAGFDGTTVAEDEIDNYKSAIAGYTLTDKLDTGGYELKLNWKATLNNIILSASDTAESKTDFVAGTSSSDKLFNDNMMKTIKLNNLFSLSLTEGNTVLGWSQGGSDSYNNFMKYIDSIDGSERLMLPYHSGSVNWGGHNVQLSCLLVFRPVTRNNDNCTTLNVLKSNGEFATYGWYKNWVCDEIMFPSANGSGGADTFVLDNVLDGSLFFDGSPYTIGGTSYDTYIRVLDKWKLVKEHNDYCSDIIASELLKQYYLHDDYTSLMFVRDSFSNQTIDEFLRLNTPLIEVNYGGTWYYLLDYTNNIPIKSNKESAIVLQSIRAYSGGLGTLPINYMTYYEDEKNTATTVDDEDATATWMRSCGTIANFKSYCVRSKSTNNDANVANCYNDMCKKYSKLSDGTTTWKDKYLANSTGTFKILDTVSAMLSASWISQVDVTFDEEQPEVTIRDKDVQYNVNYMYNHLTGAVIGSALETGPYMSARVHTIALDEGRTFSRNTYRDSGNVYQLNIRPKVGEDNTLGYKKRSVFNCFNYDNIIDIEINEENPNNVVLMYSPYTTYKKDAEHYVEYTNEFFNPDDDSADYKKLEISKTTDGKSYSYENGGRSIKVKYKDANGKDTVANGYNEIYEQLGLSVKRLDINKNNKFYLDATGSEANCDVIQYGEFNAYVGYKKGESGIYKSDGAYNTNKADYMEEDIFQKSLGKYHLFLNKDLFTGTLFVAVEDKSGNLSNPVCYTRDDTDTNPVKVYSGTGEPISNGYARDGMVTLRADLGTSDEILEMGLSAVYDNNMIDWVTADKNALNDFINKNVFGGDLLNLTVGSGPADTLVGSKLGRKFSYYKTGRGLMTIMENASNSNTSNSNTSNSNTGQQQSQNSYYTFSVRDRNAGLYSTTFNIDTDRPSVKLQDTYVNYGEFLVGDKLLYSNAYNSGVQYGASYLIKGNKSISSDGISVRDLDSGVSDIYLIGADDNGKYKETYDNLPKDTSKLDYGSEELNTGLGVEIVPDEWVKGIDKLPDAPFGMLYANLKSVRAATKDNNVYCIHFNGKGRSREYKSISVPSGVYYGIVVVDSAGNKTMSYTISSKKNYTQDYKDVSCGLINLALAVGGTDAYKDGSGNISIPSKGYEDKPFELEKDSLPATTNNEAEVLGRVEYNGGALYLNDSAPVLTVDADNTLTTPNTDPTKPDKITYLYANANISGDRWVHVTGNNINAVGGASDSLKINDSIYVFEDPVDNEAKLNKKANEGGYVRNLTSTYNEETNLYDIDMDINVSKINKISIGDSISYDILCDTKAPSARIANNFNAGGNVIQDNGIYSMKGDSIGLIADDDNLTRLGVTAKIIGGSVTNGGNAVSSVTLFDNKTTDIKDRIDLHDKELYTIILTDLAGNTTSYTILLTDNSCKTVKDVSNVFTMGVHEYVKTKGKNIVDGYCHVKDDIALDIPKADGSVAVSTINGKTIDFSGDAIVGMFYTEHGTYDVAYSNGDIEKLYLVGDSGEPEELTDDDTQTGPKSIVVREGEKFTIDGKEYTGPAIVELPEGDHTIIKQDKDGNITTYNVTIIGNYQIGNWEDCTLYQANYYIAAGESNSKRNNVKVIYYKENGTGDTITYESNGTVTEYKNKALVGLKGYGKYEVVVTDSEGNSILDKKGNVIGKFTVILRNMYPNRVDGNDLGDEYFDGLEWYPDYEQGHYLVVVDGTVVTSYPIRIGEGVHNIQFYLLTKEEIDALTNGDKTAYDIITRDPDWKKTTKITNRTIENKITKPYTDGARYSGGVTITPNVGDGYEVWIDGVIHYERPIKVDDEGTHTYEVRDKTGQVVEKYDFTIAKPTSGNSTIITENTISDGKKYPDGFELWVTDPGIVVIIDGKIHNERPIKITDSGNHKVEIVYPDGTKKTYDIEIPEKDPKDYIQDENKYKDPNATKTPRPSGYGDDDWEDGNSTPRPSGYVDDEGGNGSPKPGATPKDLGGGSGSGGSGNGDGSGNGSGNGSGGNGSGGNGSGGNENGSDSSNPRKDNGSSASKPIISDGSSSGVELTNGGTYNGSIIIRVGEDVEQVYVDGKLVPMTEVDANGGTITVSGAGWHTITMIDKDGNPYTYKVYISEDGTTPDSGIKKPSKNPTGSAIIPTVSAEKADGGTYTNGVTITFGKNVTKILIKYKKNKKAKVKKTTIKGTKAQSYTAKNEGIYVIKSWYKDKTTKVTKFNIDRSKAILKVKKGKKLVKFKAKSKYKRGTVFVADDMISGVKSVKVNGKKSKSKFKLKKKGKIKVVVIDKAKNKLSVTIKVK